MQVTQIGNVMRVLDEAFAQYSGSYLLTNEQAISLSRLLASSYTEDDIRDWMDGAPAGRVGRVLVELDEMANKLDPKDAAEIREFRDFLAMRRRAKNAEWQITYMCEEIGKALGLGTQSPADTVNSVRQLKAFADSRTPTPPSPA